MNRIILIIAAIAAGYAVGKRCARVRQPERFIVVSCGDHICDRMAFPDVRIWGMPL